MSKIDKGQLIDSLYSSLNKKYDTKSYKLVDERNSVFVKDFCSTGCTPLNIAISNRVGGGIPYGRMTVLEGLASSGKSLVSATALAENQKKGGISIWFDNEFSVDKMFLQAIGINMDKLIYTNYEFIEDMMDATETMIYEIREHSRKLSGRWNSHKSQLNYDADAMSRFQLLHWETDSQVWLNVQSVMREQLQEFVGL